jgi:hypothetical protein
MPKYRKRPNLRDDHAHRVLFYLAKRTSARYPEWRDATIHFLWELFEIRDQNRSIEIVLHREDGIRVHYDAQPIAYFHLRQQHILVFAKQGFLLWSKEWRPFSVRHKGEWPAMWRCERESELDAFLRRVRSLPVRRPKVNATQDSRYIPQSVREEVLERDEGCCVHVEAGVRCRAATNLHFDHKLAYSKGGATSEAKNIQILCRRHNLQKRNS